jgi:NDP-sugar pyrophosphorylase family protein
MWPTLATLGISIIGSNCNFGAGTTVANLRHDDCEVRSYIKGRRTNSGRRKLGVIMGDDVKTGINTSIYPGTVIEPGSRGRPGEVLRGWVVSQKSIPSQTKFREY